MGIDNIPNQSVIEMSEFEKAAYDAGYKRGYEFGKEWRSNLAHEGNYRGFMANTEQLKQNLSKSEKVAFDNGYKQGEIQGKTEWLPEDE
ncbi:MAG TPA: hypothetical protein VJG67_03495 [Candidatus Paceibacterota bacterium]